ncbi:hypothetical protein Taro_046857 [Colocasia esculenta]|uniref:Uncharacterized protein n=1 Tax=Colocasia esculenta TaxID=4460 RepID=A0A843WUS3_COLES|nr:hypothetical protein [Colocasia esculenta]
MVGVALPATLHPAPTFPCPIRHHLTLHDPPTRLLQPLEALGKQGHENRARERENRVSRTYNSSKGVRVSRSDDTDLDGTTQVPGQSPELTAWLIKNLGHPTGEVGVNPDVA